MYFRNLETLPTDPAHPHEYLELTSKGIAVVTLILVIPFGIYCLIMGRLMLALACLAFVLICLLYLWSCKRGHCKRAFIAYPVTPLMMVTMPIILNKLGVVGVYWSLPAAIALYFLLSIKWAIVANMFLIATVVPTAILVLDFELVTRFMAVLIGVNVFSAISVYTINKQYLLLKSKAVTDPLTELYNRSLLQQTLNHAIHQFKRSSVPATLLMMDLDHFKSINDELGHDVGDQVLQQFANQLRQSFRGTDMLFRAGGEEFLVLTYDADKDRAIAIAEKFRAEIEQQNFIPARKVTVSIGIAQISRNQDSNQWLKQCDQKLYQAKHAGRNQVAF